MMDSLETLVAHVQGLSGSGDDITHLQGLLKQSEEVLRQHAARLANALHQLDPAKHSLGYLYILEAQPASNLSREQAEAFLNCTVGFINVCSAEQIRLAPDKFNSLCRKLKDLALQFHEPARAILPLRTAVLKLQPSSEFLTPLHAEFLLVCILSKCYKAGLALLEDDIFEIDQKKTGLLLREFLLYCYYGGMIYIGLKRFGKALEFLQHVLPAITAPAVSLNAITIAAFKKFVLVCLIQNGQLPPFPKYTPSVVQRSLRSYAQEYVDLANLYTSRNIADITRSVSNHEDAFKKDNNLGLAKQVVSSIYKRNIHRLTQTYLTLSLQDIADTVQLEGPREAELHVLRMIQDGDIFATINQKDGMVSFLEDPEQYNTEGMTERLDLEIHQVIRLAKKLTSVDEQISCDHAYLSKIGQSRTRYDPEDFELPQKLYPNL